MKKFVFEGNSDDTFGEYNVTNEDYDNCANGKPIQYRLIGPSGEGYLITGIYGGQNGMGNGCWMIGVESLDEEKPVQWSVHMEPCFEGYHNRLTVFAPEDTRLELVRD